MLNMVAVTGRLVKDPDLRYTQSGVAVANFRVAVDRNFKDQSGERGADFFDVVVWRKGAETVANHLTKGRLVGIQGRLQSRNYEKDGQKRTTVEIVAENVTFLDRPKDSGDQTGSADEEAEMAAVGAGEEDVPF